MKGAEPSCKNPWSNQGETFRISETREMSSASFDLGEAACGLGCKQDLEKGAPSNTDIKEKDTNSFATANVQQNLLHTSM